jgi:hypothetical protein
MKKEYILSLLGKPDKIDSNSYDDAEIWMYRDVEKSIASAIKSSGVNYKILHGTGSIGHDLIGGVIYTIINAGMGVMLANELEIIIKDDKVVASRGSI